MPDLKSLEAEIREQCGEDFLQDLRKSVLQYRRERFLSIAGYVFFGLFFGGGFLGLVGTSKWNECQEYKQLTNGLSTQAEVLKLNYGDQVKVSYKFELSGASIEGRSPIPHEKARTLRAGDTIDVLYMPDRPSSNRPVFALHPFSFEGYEEVPIYVIIMVPWGLFFFAYKWKMRAHRKFDPAFLEYMANAPEPSPHAWQLYSNSKSNERRGIDWVLSYDCAHALLPKDFEYPLSKIYDGLAYRVLICNWADKYQGAIEFQEFFRRLNFLVRYVQRRYEPMPMPNIPIPEVIDTIPDDCIPIMFNLRMLAENGSADKPDIGVLELDFSGLDLQSVLLDEIRSREISNKVRGRMHLTSATEAKAVEKALAEANLGEQEKPYKLKHISPSGEMISSSAKSSTQALYFIRVMLFNFFTTPWRQESLVRKLIYNRRDGQSVWLRLEYEPGRCIRVERQPIEHQNVAITDPVKELTGSYSGVIENTPYLFDRALPNERVDRASMKIRFRSLGLSGAVAGTHSKSYVKESIQSLMDLPFTIHRRKTELQGIRLFAARLKRCFFWPLRIAYGDSALFRRAEIKIPIERRSFARWITGTKQRRTALHNLFDLGVESITLKWYRWELDLDSRTAESANPHDLVRSVLPRLREFTNDIERQAIETARRDKRIAKLRIWFNIGLFLFLVAMVFVVGNSIGNHGQAVYDFGLTIWALPYAIGLYVVCFYWFWCSSRMSHYGPNIFSLLLWMFLFVPALLIPTGGAIILNQVLDHSEGRVVTTEIIGKGTEEFSRLLVVRSWQDNQSSINLLVDKNVQQAASPDRHKLQFTLYPGYFGYAWFKDEKLIDSGEL